MNNFENRINQLNTVAMKNFSVIGSVTFHYGDLIVKTTELLNRLIPFGKAIVLCEQEDYEKIAKPLSDHLRNNGIKAIILIESKTDSESLKEQLIKSIPEDARCIVATSNWLYNVAGELAGELNLYGVFTCHNLDFSNLLNYEVKDKNKVTKLDFDRNIILDVDRILENQESLPVEFAFIMSKLTALIDYRIFGILTGTVISKDAYNLVREAVEETYSIFSSAREEYVYTLIANSIKIRLANLISKGIILKNSAVDVAVSDCDDLLTYLSYAKRVTKIYALCFSMEFDGVETPDYFERAQALCEQQDDLKLEISTWIARQAKISREKRVEIATVKQKLHAEVLNYLKIFDKVSKTYIALGGTIAKSDDFFVKSAGDGLGVFNGITLARESGICEFL